MIPRNLTKQTMAIIDWPLPRCSRFPTLTGMRLSSTGRLHSDCPGRETLLRAFLTGIQGFFHLIEALRFSEKMVLTISLIFNLDIFQNQKADNAGAAAWATLYFRRVPWKKWRTG